MGEKRENETMWMRLLAVAAFAALLGCGLQKPDKETYLRKGKEQLQKQDFAEAEISFRNVLQADPKSAEAFRGLGAAFLGQEKPLDAFAASLQSTQLAPADDQNWISLGDISAQLLLINPAAAKQPYDKLSEAAQKLLARDPRSFHGNLFEGYLRVADKKPAEAARSFLAAYAIEPQPRVAGLAARSLFETNQVSEGEKLLRDALSRNPDYAPLSDILYFQLIKDKREADAEEVLKRKVAAAPKIASSGVQLALHYRRSKREAEMKSALEAVLQSADDGYLAVGDFYRDTGDRATARQYYEKGLSSKPDLKLSFSQRIVGLDIAEGKLPEAAARLDQLRKQFPDDRDVASARASVRLASDDPQELAKAVTELEALVKKSPNVVELRYNLSRAYRRLGRYPDARRELLAVGERNGGYLPALRDLARVNLESVRLDDAQEAAQRALAVDPGNPEIRLVQTAVWALQGNRARARNELRVLTREFPNLTEGYLQLAQLLSEEGKFSEAEALYRKHYRPGQTPASILRGLVEIYFNGQRGAQAVALIEEEVKRQPESEPLRRILASTAARAGQYDLAITHFRWLTEKQPSSGELHASLGLAYQGKRDFAAALQSFEQALKLQPNEPALHAALGYALQESGKPAEAIPHHRKALALDPNYGIASINLAVALADSGGDLNEAQELVRRGLTANPRDPSFAATLGYVLRKKKDFSGAIQAYRTALARSPENPSYQLQLAQSLLDSGDTAGARTALGPAAAKKQLLPEDETRQLAELSQRLRE